MTNPADIKALVFDVFGTIVDWRNGVAREAAAFLARHAADLDPFEFADAWRVEYSPSMEEIRSGRRRYVRLDVLHRENLVRTLDRYGIDGAPDDEIDALNLAWHRLDPWPDSVAALQRLKQRYVIAPLSNGNIRVDSYDPAAFKDEEKERLLAAIDQKIAGKQVTLQPAAEPAGAEIIDLVEALRASLRGRGTAATRPKSAGASVAEPAPPNSANRRAALWPPTRLLRLPHPHERWEPANSMSRQERYRMRDVQRMLGVSRTVIARLVVGGFVQPTRGHGRETLFSFRDVVMLRTAHSLRKAGIPPWKIARALENLRATWSADKDLTAIRITAIGADVAVHDRDGPWDAHTGQLLLNFEPTPACAGSGNVREIQKRRAPGEFAAAAAREAAGDSDGAETGYRRAIESDKTYLDAYLSLGCLLSDGGRYDEAIDVWRKALLEAPGHHLLHFNLGVALEDSGRLEQALIAYRRSIELKHDFADAHFNAARIHEELGQQTHAIRHYNAYRTLNRDG